MPIRQAYLNDMIPSQQRATVLSFDSLMGSSGGVVIQPVLGKAADATSYGTSFASAALFQLLAVPFLFRSRREGADADRRQAPGRTCGRPGCRALAQSTESRSTTNTSGSCGAITPPAPRAP